MDQTVFAEPGEFAQYVRHPDLASVIVPSHQRKFLAHIIGQSDEPLPNYIHPIFAFESWYNISMAQWSAFSPALQVASHLIQQTAVWSYYAHVLRADITNDGANAVLVSSVESKSTHMKAIVETAIADLTFNWRLKFGFDNLDDNKGFVDAITLSSTIAFESYRKSGRKLHVPALLADPRIYLNVQHLHNVEYLYEAGLPDDLEIVHLRIAIALCHELAHLMWIYRHKGFIYELNQTLRTDEPHASVFHTGIELGDDLECWVFGQVTWSTNHPRDVVAYWETSQNSYHIRHLIPRWWTHMWFNNRLWASGYFDQLHRSGQLSLPTAAESVYTFVHGPGADEWVLFIRGVLQKWAVAWPDEKSHVAQRCLHQIRFLKGRPTKPQNLPAPFHAEDVRRQLEYQHNLLQQRSRLPQYSHVTYSKTRGLSPHFRITPDVPIVARQWHNGVQPPQSRDKHL